MIEPPQPSPAAASAPPRLGPPLVLVGLMGAGKTSVGKRLAALLGVPFVDADHEIARPPACRSPRSSLARRARVPRRRAPGDRPAARRAAEVLATGGGAFIEPRTRAEITARATSVWLRAELDLLWDRVRDRPGRPLLQAPDPRAVLADLDRRRSPIYAEADIIVDSRRGASHETMAREIVAAVRAHDRAAGPERRRRRWRRDRSRPSPCRSAPAPTTSASAPA